MATGLSTSTRKKAKVIPIPKSGGSSYRPISLLHNISKIMEKMIANRLTWIFPAHQSLFGFIRAKSTTDAIAQLIDDITSGRKSTGKNKTTAVTFLDLDKAFERAQPPAILESLITLGFKGKILAWLKDNLSNRTIVVALYGFNSKSTPQTQAFNKELFSVTLYLTPLSLLYSN